MVKFAALFFWGFILVAQLPLLQKAIWQNFSNYFYGWSILISIVSAVILIGWRWDWRLRLPQKQIEMGFLSAAILVILAAGIRNSAWLASFGFLLFAISFLLTHRERSTENSLVDHWPLFLLLVGFPRGGDQYVLDFVNRLTADSTTQLLRLAAIPHLRYDNTISIQGYRFYLDEQIPLGMTLPVFCSLAVVYSVARRRNWGESLFAFLASTVWYLVFEISVTLVAAMAKNWNVGDWTTGWSYFWLSLICLAFVALLFLSFERFWRTLLFPINEKSSDSKQTNPLVYYWNYLFDRRNLQTQSSGTDSLSRPRVLGLLLVFLVCCVTFILEFRIAMKNGFATKSSDGVQTSIWQPASTIFSNVVGDSEIVDHRLINKAINPAWGNYADVWTFYLTSRTTDLVITQKPGLVRDLNPIYIREGWKLIESKEVDTSNLEGSAQLKFVVSKFTNEAVESAILCFGGLNDAGVSVELRRDSASTIIQPCKFIHTWTRFSNKNSPVAAEPVVNDFLKVLQIVRKELGS